MTLLIKGTQKIIIGNMLYIYKEITVFEKKFKFLFLYNALS